MVVIARHDALGYLFQTPRDNHPGRAHLLYLKRRLLLDHSRFLDTDRFNRNPVASRATKLFSQRISYLAQNVLNAAGRVNVLQDALAVIIAQHGGRLLGVNPKPVPDSIRLIIRSVHQSAPQLSHLPSTFGGLEST